MQPSHLHTRAHPSHLADSDCLPPTWPYAPPGPPPPPSAAPCPAYSQIGYVLSTPCANTAAGSTCKPIASFCASGYTGTPSNLAAALTCSSSTSTWPANQLTGCTMAGVRYCHCLPRCYCRHMLPLFPHICTSPHSPTGCGRLFFVPHASLPSLLARMSTCFGQSLPQMPLPQMPLPHTAATDPTCVCVS